MTQLHLDLHARSDIPTLWTFGGSVGRAALLLRKDVGRHLQMCRDELGFRFVRVDGLLSGDMRAVRPDGSPDLSRVELALDRLVENGLMPYVVLADPHPLAADGSADWARWADDIRALATMIDGRYGCDAREWYFEVPPAAPRGADGKTGSAEDYFRRYDAAVRAIKGVHPEFRVGGPGTGDAALLDAFLAHVAAPAAAAGVTTASGADTVAAAADAPHDVPAEAGVSATTAVAPATRCDFVTTHVAGAADALAAVKRRVADALGPHVPLIVGGGSGPAAAVSEGNDECAEAAFVCQTMLDLAGVVEGTTLWGATDIAEDEHGRWRYEPFHGGPGLVTVNDVRKAAFHAFRLLGEHRGYHCQRVGTTWGDAVPGLNALASVEEYTLRLLCWYYPTTPVGGTSNTPPAAATGTTPAPTGPARFTIEGLPDSVRTANVEILRPGAGSAYEAWVELGRPPFATRDLLDVLEVAAHPAITEVDVRDYPPRLEPGMVMQLTFHLPYDEPWQD